MTFEHVVIGFFVKRQTGHQPIFQGGGCQHGAEGDVQRLPGVELLQQAGQVGIAIVSGRGTLARRAETW